MIPSEIVSGDSISWYDAAFKDNIGTDILPSAWTLTYKFNGATTLSVAATVVNDQWYTALTAAQTGAFTAGVYYWTAIATLGLDRKTLGSGQVRIKPNLATASAGFDNRSQARIDLANVQAAIRALISGGAVKRYAIAGREVEKMALADLIALESKLKYEVTQEEKAEAIRQGLGNPNNLYVRFR